MIRFILLVFFFAFSSASFAQTMTRMKFGEGWDIIRSGNSVRFVPSGWGGTGAVAMPASTWAGAPGKLFTSGTGVKVVGEVALPVAESLVPVVAEAAVSRAGFARGVAMVGFGAAGGWLGILAAAPSVIEWLESSGKLQLDRTSGVMQKGLMAPGLLSVPRIICSLLLIVLIEVFLVVRLLWLMFGIVAVVADIHYIMPRIIIIPPLVLLMAQL